MADKPSPRSPVSIVKARLRYGPPRFYNWRAKYGGMQVSEVKRLKELEDENRRLKKMYAELSLQNEVIKEALAKKWQGLLSVE
ncbi:transposase [Spirosoma jeollabukense]